MFTVLSLAAIAVALYFIWKPNFEDSKQNKFDATNNDNAEQNILNLSVGSVIKINNAGENFEDLDLKVLAKHLYTQGGYEWFEYECSAGDRKYFISVEDDDEVSIGLSLDKLKLKDLGLTKSQLKEIDDKEDGEFSYKGKTFAYDDSAKATFVKNGDEEGYHENFYYWEFEDEDEEFFVTVENWDGSYEVSYGKYIELRQINFYN